MASQNINSELGILKANGYVSRFMQWSQTILNGVYSLGKVQIFWEGHKILWNPHLTFEWHYIGQK